MPQEELTDIHTMLGRAYLRGVGLRLSQQEVRQVYRQPVDEALHYCADCRQHCTQTVAAQNQVTELLAICEAVLADVQDIHTESRLSPEVGFALCAAINKAKGEK